MNSTRSELPQLKSLALKRLVIEDKIELEKCLKITQGNKLTIDEYSHADEEFKTLVDTPWQKKEPLYIFPDFDEKSEVVSSKMRELIAGIQQAQPYHTFITDTYGTTWPLLLRLFYGLKSGFKISIEQMHSMLKVSYWRGLGLNVEMSPIFGKQDESLTEAGKRLVLTGFHFSQNTQREKFLSAIASKSIPKAERSIQVVTLNTHYLQIAMYAGQQYATKNKLRQIDSILNQYYKLFIEPTEGPYSEDNAFEKSHELGAGIFASMIYDGLDFYRIFLINNKPVLLLPSQTMLNVYQEAINPERKLQYIRRLGPFGPELMEAYSNNNKRPGNLIAPGINNTKITHRRVMNPAFAVEHDDYHHLLEIQFTKNLYLQMTRAKDLLRQCLDNKAIFTSEIFRCIDRERPEYDTEKTKFLELMKYVFHFNHGDNNIPFSPSSVLVLIDMILAPEHWPHYLSAKHELVNLLLPLTKQMPANQIANLEKITKLYADKVKQNYPIIAMLLLCHFYLNDPQLSQSLVQMIEKNPDLKLITWNKKEHGNLYPILVANKDYTLEMLAEMKPGNRLKILKKIIPTSSVDLKSQCSPDTSLKIESKVEINSVKDATKETIKPNQQISTAYPFLSLQELCFFARTTKFNYKTFSPVIEKEIKLSRQKQ